MTEMLKQDLITRAGRSHHCPICVQHSKHPPRPVAVGSDTDRAKVTQKKNCGATDSLHGAVLDMAGTLRVLILERLRVPCPSQKQGASVELP